MIQSRFADEVPDRAAIAALRIPRPEYEPVHAGVDHRAGAHGAGLESDVHSATFQSPALLSGGGLSQRDHLGMRHRVAPGLPAVVPATDHLPGAHNHRAHRNLSGGSRETGLVESQPHGRAIVPYVHSASNRNSTHFRLARRRRVRAGCYHSGTILVSTHGRGIEK